MITAYEVSKNPGAVHPGLGEPLGVAEEVLHPTIAMMNQPVEGSVPRP